MIQTEHYTLDDTQDDKIWLYQHDGDSEAMVIDEKELDRILDDYYRENF